MFSLVGMQANYVCVSTDDKDALDVPENTIVLELDTGDFYFFDGTNWQKVGGE